MSDDREKKVHANDEPDVEAHKKGGDRYATDEQGDEPDVEAHRKIH